MPALQEPPKRISVTKTTAVIFQGHDGCGFSLIDDADDDVDDGRWDSLTFGWITLFSASSELLAASIEAVILMVDSVIMKEIMNDSH